MSIQVFNEINDSHAATGYRGRTDIPTFHVFAIGDTYPDTHQVMPPYTFRFYQIVLLENSPDATLRMNTLTLGDLSDSLSFASPDHVLAWIRGEQQRGFIVYFKEEFLAHHPNLAQDEFPYFRQTEINFLRVNPADKQLLREHFERLITAYQYTHPYRFQILQSLLLILLFECKRLYNLEEQTIQCATPKYALALRFQHFVNQHYLTRKTVQEYADLLNVSPDYLGQAIKAATGKTPLSLITEHIIFEAKKLLIYTDLNVVEIADYLGYDEPTHFGRFFRRNVGISPHVWRREQE